MIQDAIDRRNDQERRVLLKTQDQQLVHRAVHGAGLSPWEAEVLVETVEEVYFAQGPTQTIRAGQVGYECVAADQPPGKTLSDCRMIGVVLPPTDGTRQRATGTCPADQSRNPTIRAFDVIGPIPFCYRFAPGNTANPRLLPTDCERGR